MVCFKRVNADLIQPESIEFILLFSNSGTTRRLGFFWRLNPRQCNTQHAYSLLTAKISLRFQDLRLEKLHNIQALIKKNCFFLLKLKNKDDPNRILNSTSLHFILYIPVFNIKIADGSNTGRGVFFGSDIPEFHKISLRILLLICVSICPICPQS